MRSCQVCSDLRSGVKPRGLTREGPYSNCKRARSDRRSDGPRSDWRSDQGQLGLNESKVRITITTDIGTLARARGTTLRLVFNGNFLFMT